MEGLTLTSYVPLLVFQAYYNPPSKPRPNLRASILVLLQVPHCYEAESTLCRVVVCHFKILFDIIFVGLLTISPPSVFQFL